MTENDDKTKIETTGDYSPGIVKGNYTINKTIIRQYETKRKIEWRNLETAIFPIITDNINSRNRYASEMGFALHKTFSDTKFKKFTGLIKKTTEVKNGQNVSFYELFCHQIEFCAALQQEQTNFISSLISFKEQYPRNIAKEKLAEIFIKPKEDFYHDWNLAISYDISEFWAPIEFTYDRATKRIAITGIQNNEMNLSDYPDRISTTSEMLVLLSGLLSAHFVFSDDSFWLRLEKNYPLTKLFVDFLDNRAFFFNRLRINVDDYDEWDYVNVSFDDEVEIKKKLLTNSKGK